LKIKLKVRYKLIIIHGWTFIWMNSMVLASMTIIMIFCIKLYNFYGLNMNIHACYFLKKFHPFEYLRYWICTNIVHIKHNKNFCKFFTNLWKLDFTQNLYKLMKLHKYVGHKHDKVGQLVILAKKKVKICEK
jgi:hypothetical protein